MTATRSVADILHDAEETLRTAELGLSDLVGADPTRRLAGLRNAVVFGRAVTNVLENLRGCVPSFDDWYRPVAKRLSDDPLMKFFYKLRSEILKQGKVGVAGSVSIENLSLPRDAARFGIPPPNARGFFAGDATGEMGWDVVLPDGSIEKYYVALPADIGHIDTFFKDAPMVNGTQSVPALTRAYLAAIRLLLLEAKARFGAGG